MNVKNLPRREDDFPPVLKYDGNNKNSKDYSKL